MACYRITYQRRHRALICAKCQTTITSFLSPVSSVGMSLRARLEDRLIECSVLVRAIPGGVRAASSEKATNVAPRASTPPVAWEETQAASAAQSYKRQAAALQNTNVLIGSAAATTESSSQRDIRAERGFARNEYIQKVCKAEVSRRRQHIPPLAHDRAIARRGEPPRPAVYCTAAGSLKIGTRICQGRASKSRLHMARIFSACRPGVSCQSQALVSYSCHKQGHDKDRWPRGMECNDLVSSNPLQIEASGDNGYYVSD